MTMPKTKPSKGHHQANLEQRTAADAAEKRWLSRSAASNPPRRQPLQRLSEPRWVWTQRNVPEPESWPEPRPRQAEGRRRSRRAGRARTELCAIDGKSKPLPIASPVQKTSKPAPRLSRTPAIFASRRLPHSGHGLFGSIEFILPGDLELFLSSNGLGRPVGGP